MYYYVNTVHERFPVARIVEEKRRACPRLSLTERVTKKGTAGVARAVLRRGKALLARKEISLLEQERRRELGEILGVKAIGFPKGVQITAVEDINSLAVRDLLQEERPDVILVQGTSIVRDATLPEGVFNFNMHAGLSPYYRGGNCTGWALVNWDPYNIGVTLHRLTERADAGPIIVQGRVVPSESDTVNSIELKLTREGAGLAVKVLERFEKGEPIHYHEQDMSVGHCYLSRHWHPELNVLLQRIDRQRMIAQMLKTPSTRVRQPIVEWTGD